MHATGDPPPAMAPLPEVSHVLARLFRHPLIWSPVVAIAAQLLLAAVAAAASGGGDFPKR